MVVDSFPDHSSQAVEVVEEERNAEALHILGSIDGVAVVVEESDDHW